jgi:hypothetical protein
MVRRTSGERVQKLERSKQRTKFRIASRHGYVVLVCLLALPVMAVILLSHSVPRPVETTQAAARLAELPKLTIIDLEDQEGKQRAKTTTAISTPKLSYTSVASSSSSSSSSSWHSPDDLNPTHHNLWHNSTVLPAWMKEYFAWHAQEIRLLTAENYPLHKFLVLRCLATDQTCGGASDRLKPLPILIKLAAQSKRLFFIYWSRPCLLEEFLVPAPGGLNWTVPEWLVPELTDKKSSRLYTKVTTVAKGVNRSTPIVCARIQDQHGGSEIYNQLEGGDRAYRKVFRSLFHNVLFAPSPPVAALLEQEMNKAGLVPGAYVAAHLRTAYGTHPLEPRHIRRASVNAINCASHLRPAAGGPIYFASDSREATQGMERIARKQPGKAAVVTIVPETEALHLDKAASTRPWDYYNIFVDLYLLANANCISHGQGGFGRFGVLLSRNASCFFKYFAEGQYVTCDWKDVPNASSLSASS